MSQLEHPFTPRANELAILIESHQRLGPAMQDVNLLFLPDGDAGHRPNLLAGWKGDEAERSVDDCGCKHRLPIYCIPAAFAQRQATAAMPCFSTSERSLSAGPDGRFSPRSHLLTR